MFVYSLTAQLWACVTPASHICSWLSGMEPCWSFSPSPSRLDVFCILRCLCSAQEQEAVIKGTVAFLSALSSRCWHVGDQQSVTNNCVMVKVTEITFSHFSDVPCQHTPFSCFSKNISLTLLPRDSLFASEHIFLKKDSNQSHFIYIMTPHTVDSRHYIVRSP